MKTNLLILSLLMLAAQAVKSQSTGSQANRSLPIIGSNTLTSKQKPAPTLVSEEPAAPAVKKYISIFFTYSKDLPSSSFTRDYAEKILTEATELLLAEQLLRKDLKNPNTPDKENIKESASLLLKQAQLKQLIAAEIMGKLNFDQFTLNFNLINSLLVKLEFNTTLYNVFYDKKQETFYMMKMAREMREEAYSISNVSSMIGVLNNAEEKEVAVLNNQFKLISDLKKAVAMQKKNSDQEFEAIDLACK